jgi:hypothetical protein
MNHEEQIFSKLTILAKSLLNKKELYEKTSPRIKHQTVTYKKTGLLCAPDIKVDTEMDLVSTVSSDFISIEYDRHVLTLGHLIETTFEEKVFKVLQDRRRAGVFRSSLGATQMSIGIRHTIGKCVISLGHQNGIHSTLLYEMPLSEETYEELKSIYLDVSKEAELLWLDNLLNKQIQGM